MMLLRTLLTLNFYLTHTLLRQEYRKDKSFPNEILIKLWAQQFFWFFKIENLVFLSCQSPKYNWSYLRAGLHLFERS